MREYFTTALVLGEENTGELDKLVDLYTEELGRVRAKTKSIRKITSKLSAQLQPLNFARVRLIEKNGFRVVDALKTTSIPKSADILEFFQFAKEMTPELQKDKKLWLFLKKFIAKNPPQDPYREFLKISGFDPDFSRCHKCNGHKPQYFSKEDQIFFCEKCVSKIPKDELILIK